MDRPLARRRPRWLLPALIGAVGCAAIAAFVWVVVERGAGRRLHVGSGRVVVAAVELGQFEDFVPIRGRVVPRRTIYLDAVEGGRVEKVLVEDGARVQKDQLLVQLSNTTLQLDVISREAQVTEQINNLNTLELQLEQNRLEHRRNLVETDYQIARLTGRVERRRALVDGGSISQEEFRDLEIELDYWRRRRAVLDEAQRNDERLQRAQMQQLRAAAGQLRKNLAVARKNLDSLNVRAPMAGKVTALNAEIGQSLQRGERLGQVDDPAHFKVSAMIDEFYLPRVAIGQLATVHLAGERWELEVAKIYPQVRQGRFEVDLIFRGDLPQGIRRGQTLQMRWVLGDPSETLLLPNAAFFQDTGGNWVFVLSDDGDAATRRAIRTGRRNARFVEVLEGLDVGERVIVSAYTAFTEMDRLVLEGDAVEY